MKLAQRQWLSETRRGPGNPMWGRKRIFSPEHREKLRQARLARPDRSALARAAVAAQQSRMTQAEKDECGRRMLRAQVAVETAPERVVRFLLEASGRRFERQKPIGPWRVDFYVSSCNLVIEVDGWWHQNTTEVQARDKRKNADLLARGFNVLRVEVD